jgi:hypothetical protein
MRKLSWIFALVFMAYACNTEDITPMDGADALGKNSSNAKRNNVNAPAKEAYTSLEASESSGVFTIILDQTGRYAVSHLLLQFVDCDGAHLDASAVTSATVNGEEWTVDSTTGAGTDCHFSNSESFIKLDGIEVADADVVVELTFNTMVDGGLVLVKAGSTCSEPLAINASNCPIETVCHIWENETAYAGDNAGSGAAWWFTFDGEGEQKIYAGKKAVAGASVKLQSGNIIITLGDNMKLDGDAESVKVLGYDELPTTRPESGKANPNQIYAGTALTVSVAEYAHYVIHLDVEVKTPCVD